MAKLIPTMFLAVSCSCLTGCMGSIQTRVGPCGPQLLGWPLYSGILTDVHVVIHGHPDGESGIGVLLAYLSFPLDFVVDTVLLVPDLCAGALGCRKIDFNLPAVDAGESSQDTGRPNKTMQPTGAPSGARG
jgi:hypothetical protein